MKKIMGVVATLFVIVAIAYLINEDPRSLRAVLLPIRLI